MSNYFPKPKSLGGILGVKVELDLSYVTKADFKKVTGVVTSEFAKKTALANSKPDVDDFDIDKLKTVPVDLSKQSSVVSNDVVKKTEYNKLVTKVNAIDTSGFVLKTQYNTDKSSLENKINDADKKYLILVELLKKQTDYNAKITEIEGKIPSITGLATIYALNLNDVKNKIPDVSNLVKKTDYDAKISFRKNNLQILIMTSFWYTWCRDKRKKLVN